MAKYQLSTMDARYEMSAGMLCKMSTLITGPGNNGKRETVDCKSLDELRQAIIVYGTATAAAMPGISFEVYPRLIAGRKPNGFDQALRTGDKLACERWVKTIA